MLACVASQAGFIRLRRGELRKLPDLCHVAAAVHVRFDRAMAALVADALAAVFKGKALVRIGGEFLCGLLVASGAGLRTDIIGGAYWLGFVGGPARRLLGGRLTQPWSENEEKKQPKPQAMNDASHTLSPPQTAHPTELIETKMIHFDHLGR